MKTVLTRSLALLLMAAVGLAGCAPAAATAEPQAAATILPAAPTTPPTPAFTPTPRIFQPPAGRFLPVQQDLGADYAVETSLLSENIATQAALPVPPESMAVASFRNAGTGTARATDPQNGLYYRLTWWVVLAESESNARFLYGISQSKDYAKNAFLLVMPAALHDLMGEPTAVPIEKGACDDISLSSYVSDTYADFRGEGPLPTLDPMMAGMTGNNDPELLAKLPPDLFLYGACRVNNAIILFWGHAPDNSDGHNAPIPPEVIASQVQEKMNLVVEKLK